MTINLFASLFRLSSLLGEGSHSLLVTTQKRSRDFLVTTISESFYLAMSFTFVAFLVGLSASLRWRYKDQFVSGFVRNNLPALGNPSNQTTWETFEHIGIKELTLPCRGPLPFSFDSPLLERIDVYDDLFIVKPRRPWEKLRGQKHLGLYRPSPVQHQRAALGTSLAAMDLSHPLTESELSRELWPPSALAGSAWLHVPARGFVEFPVVSASWQQPGPFAPKAPTPSVTLGLHADAEQRSGASNPSSMGWDAVESEPLAHPFAPATKVGDTAGLTKPFNVGSYPLRISPTLMATTGDQGRFDAAATNLHRSSRGLGRVWGSAQRQGRILPLSPLQRWLYQFCAYLDDIPNRLGSPKLLQDDGAMIEEAKPLVASLQKVGKPVGPQRADASLEGKPKAPEVGLHPDEPYCDSGHTAPKPVQRDAKPKGVASNPGDVLRGQCIGSGELYKAEDGFQVPLDRLQPDPVLGSKSDATWHQLSSRANPLEAEVRFVIFKAGIAKPIKDRLSGAPRALERGDGLVGVRARDVLGKEVPLLPEGGTPQGVGGATPHSPLPSFSSPRLIEPSRASSPVSEVAPPPLTDLVRNRQVFGEEALSLLRSDSLVCQPSQGWDPLPPLLSELNSAEVAASLEEGVEALEAGWDELLALVTDSVLGVLQSIKPIPTRPMSGYSYPDSTRRKLARDLSHWAARHGLDLREAAATLLLAETEVLLPGSPSLPLIRTRAQDLATAKRRVHRQVPPIPIAEIDYRPISLSGLASLLDVLPDLNIEALEDELDEISIFEPTYLGPAVARDNITNDLVGNGKEELAAWVAKAIQGHGRGDASGVLANPEAALSLRQGNRLGKQEMLRGEAFVDEKLVAGVRAHTGVDVVVARDKTVESSKGVEAALPYLQPMKSNKMAPERFLTGLGPKLRDPSQILALERGDEAPVYPLEIVFTKAAPIFEEEEEVLSLEPDEWHKIFKGVVVQAMENKTSLDKIEVLLPCIAVAHSCPGRELEAANMTNPTKGGAPAWATGQLQRGDLTDSHGSHSTWGAHLPEKTNELARVLTSQEYANLAILIAQSKRFVGECNYWPVANPSGDEMLRRELLWADAHNPSTAGCWIRPGFLSDQGDEASMPPLLCHYLPLSQVAILESSAKQPISAGNYQKRLTSFTARYASNRQAGSASTRGGAASPFPVVRSKQQIFSQLWEPATANSWMMFYKLCFAFWIREMGRDFYKRYGKEIILYAVNLLVALGFDAQGIIDELGLEESPIRVITNGARRFADIAGIDSLLPELGEIVWFLRSGGRGGQIPKGILLVGPPGTGKTFVVQAIAGEAKVPVLVQSASSLTDPGQKQSGCQQLRDLFDRARQLSPCILFLDEIDTLGVSRPHVIANMMGADELLESIEAGGSQEEDAGSSPKATKAAKLLAQRNDDNPELDPYLSFPPSPRLSRESMLDDDEDDRPRDEGPVFREGEGDPRDSPGLDPSVVEVMEAHNEERRSRQERLAILMQFLMEIDGLRTLRGVVVIGATNRPAVLDPAFTRPGRFERILCLQLPGKQKRIEILKLYSKSLGLIDAAPPGDVDRSPGGTWEYLANRTAGWSAAHLAAAMNQSAIRAIIQETSHTIETVEHGINAIARRSFQASPNLLHQANEGDGRTLIDAGFRLDTPPPVVFVESPDSTTGRTHWSSDLSASSSRTCTGADRQAGGLIGRRGSSPTIRWAYYQAGKAVLHTLLPLHPPAAFLPLCPQPFKASSDLAKLVASTLQRGALEPQRRVVLETRLIGLYAGKASEMLGLPASARTGGASPSGAPATPLKCSPSHENHNQDTWASQSDLGLDELTFAGVVANSMITSWYLYSKRVAIQRMNLSTIACNLEEIDDPVLLDVFQHMEQDLEHEVERATRHPKRFQHWASPSWWQIQVMEEAALVEPGYADWYRIHIPDPEETERNIDWVAPEDHYHAAMASRLRNVSKRTRKGRRKSARSPAPIGTKKVIRPRPIGSLSAVTWNDLYLITRDYIYYGLINSCFQKAFLLLDRRRELVDFLVDHLIRYDLLRQYEIEQIYSNIGLGDCPSTDYTGAARPREAEQGPRRANTVRSAHSLPPDLPEGPEVSASTGVVQTGPESPACGEGVAKTPQETGPQVGNTSPAGAPSPSSNPPRTGSSSPPPLPHKVVQAGWGSHSRRRISRFIDFDFVKPCYLKRAG